MKKITPILEELIAPTLKRSVSFAGTDEDVKILIAKTLINNIKLTKTLKSISDAEFKVFSQFGDDGIIQYLINTVSILPQEENFAEFGVENYRESNTRFLLINNNWRGFIMDGDGNYIASVKNWNEYWKYDLTAVAAFVTKKNINVLFKKYGFDKDLGILSIDVDGNDYWLWQAFTVTKPVIVIVEYNSVFGKKSAVTIPYKENFYRTKAHYSNLYWGTSIKAITLLAKKKGYAFVGSNSNGNNAYFVRRDRLGKLKELNVETGYVESKYRESRNKAGSLTYVGGAERLKLIRNLKVVNVVSNKMLKLDSII